MASRREVLAQGVQDKMREVTPGINMGRTPTEGTRDTHDTPTEGTRKAHDTPTMQRIHVLMETDDINKLDALARQESTTQSALIRRAVRELIRRGGK